MCRECKGEGGCIEASHLAASLLQGHEQGCADTELPEEGEEPARDFWMSELAGGGSYCHTLRGAATQGFRNRNG